MSAREHWSAHVASWKASGETAWSYASRHGLNGNTLKWWRWRLGQDGKDLAATQDTLRFVEVSEPCKPEASSVVVVRFADCEVDVAPGTDLATLFTVLRAVRGGR